MVDSWQSAVCGAFAGAKDYIILGKTKEGEKNVKILTMQKQHSLEIPGCLNEESSTTSLGWGGSVLEKKMLKRCPLERQPICF